MTTPAPTPDVGRPVRLKRGRPLRLAAAAGVIGLAGAASLRNPAAAQELGAGAPLANTGFGGAGVQVGDLRQQFQRAFAGGQPVAAPTTAPAWILTPAISVQGQYTSNSGGNGLNGSNAVGSGFVTVITPSIGISGDTERAQVTLGYAPTINLYASQPSQNYVGQGLNADALLTLLPQTLFLDLRGFASVQSQRGTQGPPGTVALGKDNQTQSYLIHAAPYVQHRFGDFGTLEVGYSIDYSTQGGGSAVTGRTQLGLLANPAFGGQILNNQILNNQTLSNQNQSLTTQNEHVSFITGDYFGRLSNRLVASATQFDGTGVLSGAYNNTFTYDVGYAVTRTITVLARVGYEDIYYSGVPATHIQDAIWGFGVRLEPNPDSGITIGYGHQNGASSLFVDASYAPTARTRIFARYSEGFSTGQQDLQSAVNSSTADIYGNAVDRVTGAPILPTNNFFGTQTNNLTLLKRLSVTGALLYDRDVFTASLISQNQKLVAVAVGGGALGAGGPSDGTYGTLAWSHDISDAAVSNLSVTYGESSQRGLVAASSTSQLFGVSAVLTYRFSETLSGTAQYSFNRQTSDLPGGGSTSNLVVVGLNKSF